MMIRYPRQALLALLLVLGFAGTSAAEPSSPGKPKPIDFLRDVRPILSNKCFACHGPDEKTRKAKLRLDLREQALRPARSGEVAIVPGKSAASELVRRIFTAEETERMPPPASNKHLEPAEKELLKRWIDEGAEYRIHWAFVKP